MSTDANPVTYICSCPCSTDKPGAVLLFYRYFSAPPSLPSTQAITPSSLSDLQTFHKALVTTLCLGSKIRLSCEGFNITVGGTAAAINSYITACRAHWSFTGLSLTTPQEINAFFKPTPGCVCVFAGRQDVSIKTEITPLGVTGWLPRNWESVTELSPEEWHHRVGGDGGEEDMVMLDVRNYYESRLGHFVRNDGQPALLPAVRRFGQWPAYVKKLVAEGTLDRKVGGANRSGVFAYCTGGIRCEKGARWLVEEMERSGSAEMEVYTLRGGIAAYLAWVDGQIAAGHMQASESLFKGRNFVFDARGSLGLEDGETVATCHSCGKPEDRMGKCASLGCFLVLVICEECAEKDIRCCEDCRALDSRRIENAGQQRMCECEKMREEQLWGPEKTKMPKGQGWKTKKRKELEQMGKTDKLDIRVKIREPY